MPEFDVDSYLRKIRDRDDPFEWVKRRNFRRIGSRYDGV